MKPTKIETQLQRIEKLLSVQNAEPMDFKSACEYLNISKSFLYKLTSKNQIPYYKPTGKLLYFEKSELNKWLLSKRTKPESEIEQEADQILLKK